MSTNFERLREVFHVAVEQHPASQWDAYLDQACAGDRELRHDAALLLQAHAEGGSHSDLSLSGRQLTGLYRPATEAIGTLLGPYRLLEQIGEGGMGAVFVAEQQHPVRRRVAVKVIKAGMDTREVIARFEAERQALAIMDHPNIAKVFDGGVTPPAHAGGSQRPYFVMELVKGVPITQFCDDNLLPPRERLELFVSLCQAVQHAHQKGIIHRDVKPSNVLVTSHDGAPLVKVIDFGVAKAIGPHLTEKPVCTGFSQMLGTPLYMSPEQAGMSGLDIDTRTDIYALGVLLYELLTGTTPFEEARFQQASYEQIRQIIREEEPPRPSLRLSTLAQAVDTVSAIRQSDAKKLGQLRRRELDWIVMKCLEKDRNRRYETANALALDIQRYLRSEPVLAGPTAAGYRLRKFVRRNRGPVVAAALVLFALLAGLAGTVWGLVGAERARQGEAERAEAEASQRQRAEANEQRANDERDRAEEEKQIAQAVQQFLQVSLLRQADPFTQAETSRLAERRFEPKENPSVRELLDRASAELTPNEIEAKFPKQLRVQAEILQTIGRTYLGVGEYEKAIAHLVRSRDLMAKALGPDHQHTLLTMHNLAAANRRAGNTAEAIDMLEKVRDARLIQLGPKHPDTLATLNNLAGAYRDVGRTDESIDLFEKVRDARLAVLGPRHPDTLTTLNNLAAAYRRMRKTAEAIELYEQVRDARMAELGPKHPSTLSTLDSLAGAYRESGKSAEAIALYQLVHGARSIELGLRHPDTLTTANNLASAYWWSKKLDRSIPLFEDTLRLSEAGLGRDHPDTLVTMANLGINYRDAGKLPDGIALLEKALERARGLPGPMPAPLQSIARALAETYERGGQFAKAEPLCREFVEQARKKYGRDKPQVVGFLNRLGLNLLRQRKCAEAESILRDCLAICEKNATTALLAFETRALLGGALLGQSKYATAEPLLRAGYQGMKERAARILPADRGRLKEALNWLIELAEEQGHNQTAEMWRQERAAMAP